MKDNALDRFGSAGWADQSDIHKAGLHKNKQGSLFAGFSPSKNKALMLGGDGHLTIIGGAGCGKGSSLLSYNLLGKGWDSSALINDLKGELAAISLHHLHKRNLSGYCINPYNLHGKAPWFLPQHGLNPLAILSPDSITLTADIQMICAMLIVIPSATKDSYWEVRARQWCSGLLKFLILTFAKATLPDLYKLINLAESDPDTFAQMAKNDMMATNDAEVMRVAGEMLFKRKNSEREYSSIMGTIFKNLGWMDDPALQECLSGDDFSLEALTSEKAHIYLIIPAEYVATLSSFIRLIFGVGMICKQRKPDADRVLYLIDEAGQLGYFEALENAYTFGRGAGIRTCGVFQSLGQMNSYPSGYQTILGSSAARIFMGTRDYETASLVSRMIGEETLEYDAPRAQADARKAKMETVRAMLTGDDPFKSAYEGLHYSAHASRKEKIRRALITPDEVLSLPEDRMILMTSGLNCPPILARKINYFEHKDMTGTYLPNPYHPPYDRVGTKTLFRRTKRIISEAVPSDLAHWPQFQKGYWSRVV